jgi:hypothetical protein
MRLYHGSTDCVSCPRLLPATLRLDFGPGFTTTTSESQARQWSRIKKRRDASDHAMLSIYQADVDADSGGPAIRRFNSPTEEWLDFVMANRMGRHVQHSSDIVIGPVANDTLYETLTLFERGVRTRAETLVRLRTHELADQVVFHTERGLARLIFMECIEVVAS